MPDAVSLRSHAKDDRVILGIVGQGNGIVRVGGKPGLALKETAAELRAVVIEDDVSAVDAAGQAGGRHFNLGRFVARDPRIGNGDPPEPGGSEIVRPGHRIHVANFVQHFAGDSRAAGLGSEQRE